MSPALRSNSFKAAINKQIRTETRDTTKEKVVTSGSSVLSSFNGKSRKVLLQKRCDTKSYCNQQGKAHVLMSYESL